MSFPVRVYDEYFILTTDPAAYPLISGTKVETELRPGEWVNTVLAQSNPTLAGDTLLAAYQPGGPQVGLSRDDAGNIVGAPSYPISPQYWDWQQRANNADGTATGVLVAPQTIGRAVQREGDAGEQYAEGKAPIEAECRREYWDDPRGDGSGLNAGWYASVYILSSLVDPSVRSVFWQKFNTALGAFIWDDAQEMWRSPLWIGSGIITETEPMQYQLMWASLREGINTLEEGADTSRAMHWEHDA